MSKKEQADLSGIMAELQAVVTRLEGDDVEVEQALKAFEQGVSLVRQAQSILTETEQRVATLTQDLSPGEEAQATK